MFRIELFYRFSQVNNFVVIKEKQCPMLITLEQFNFRIKFLILIKTEMRIKPFDLQ